MKFKPTFFHRQASTSTSHQGHEVGEVQSTPSPCPAPIPPTPSPTPSCSSTRAPTPDERPSKKNKKTDNIDDVLRAALRKISTPSDLDADFGRVVANELRQMNDDQKKIAKKLIYDALYLGSTATLNKDHQILPEKGSHFFFD